MARAAEAGMPYQAADPGSRAASRAASRAGGLGLPDTGDLPADDLATLIQSLTDAMHAAAAELRFEYAARLRDELNELKRELRGMQAATG